MQGAWTSEKDLVAEVGGPRADTFTPLPSLCLWHTFFFKYHFNFIYLFILFLAALGLRCCAQAFSSCGEQGLLFVVVRGLLIAVASLVAEHGL